jgi:UDP-glucose:(heptosyl)LPS alpha-1,3-glucosyltransferase
LRIAIVAPFFNQRGGIERYVWHLANELAVNNQVTVVSTSFEGKESDNLSWLRVPALTKFSALLTLTFPVVAQFLLFKHRDKFDVVHGHGASCFRQDVVTAHSVHKAWFFTSLRSLPILSKSWCLKLFNPLHYVTIAVETVQMLVGNSRQVVAISGVIRKELQKFYEISPSRMVIVPSGVDHQEFRPVSGPSRLKAKAHIGVSPDSLLLLFVGNELKRKNLATILQAMAKLNLPEIVLAVVGRADASPFLKMAGDLGLAGAVKFLGASSNVSEYYDAADVFVFPTAYEAFSLVILEAMAAGLPIITTGGVGAADELFVDGHNALLLKDPSNPDELKEKILAMLNPASRTVLGNNAYLKSLQYSWRMTAEHYLKIYHAVSGR